MLGISISKREKSRASQTVYSVSGLSICFGFHGVPPVFEIIFSSYLVMVVFL